MAARGETHFGFAKPQEGLGIPRQARRANTGDSEKMQQGGFTQWELLDDTDKGRRLFRPLFAELDQSGFDLRRIQRCRCLFLNPTIPAIHRAKHHAVLMERPARAQSWITSRLQAPRLEALFFECGSRSGSCRPVRRRVPKAHLARWLHVDVPSENIQCQER